MIHVSPPPSVVIAASIPARSALICAAVEPVDVIAVAPFVIAAGRRSAESVTVFVRNWPSRYAATPATTVSLTVRSASGSPSLQEFVRQHDDLAGFVRLPG